MVLNWEVDGICFMLGGMFYDLGICVFSIVVCWVEVGSEDIFLILGGVNDCGGVEVIK